MRQQDPATTSRAIGVDVGGTTVKGSLVDLADPAAAQIRREPTPQPPTVDDVLDVAGRIARDLLPRTAGATGAPPIGVALSGDVRDGDHTSGVNLDASWVGAPAREMLASRIGAPVRIINDADAAGLAEVRYGAAAAVPGVVVVLTFGTGIGSGLFLDGRLLPNSGFGQFPFRGLDVEVVLSAVARERRAVSWETWADEVNDFLWHVDSLLRPDLVVIGGGASDAWPQFGSLLRAPCEIRPARLGSAAGVIGAASYAADPAW